MTTEGNWSEHRAVLGHSYLVMKDAFRRILARLPFAVQEIHSDNGSEFLNYHLIHFWKEMVKGVELSRSRPYHKNDNRFVEQKNSTLVRAYLGYDRLDTVAQARAVNWLYDKIVVVLELLPTRAVLEREGRSCWGLTTSSPCPALPQEKPKMCISYWLPTRTRRREHCNSI